MSRRPRPVGAAAAVAVAGVVLSLLPCLSRHDPASWSLGLLGSAIALASAVRIRGTATLVATLAVANQVLVAHPGATLVLLTATALAGYLACAETAESGRWRAGVRQTVRHHATPVCLAVAGAAGSLLVGRVVSSRWPASSVTSLVAAAVGAGAAGTLLLLVTHRRR